MTLVTVSNTNLFAVAAAFLGDATQWVRIAELNGLADSTVSGTVTMALPPVDPTATGGIAAITATGTAVTPIDIYAAREGIAAIPVGYADAVWNGFSWDDGSQWA